MTELNAALIIQNCIAGRFEQNMDSTCSFIEKAAAKGAQIAVFPEMNLTGYVTGADIYSIARPVDETLTKIFTGLAENLDMTILTGLAEKGHNKKIYATHLVFKPDGRWSKYRKIHLSPPEQNFLCQGNKIKIFRTHDFNFAVQLCYDAHFPELSLSMSLKGADIIFIAHASPRGNPEEKFISWTRHLTARAFDNGIYVAALNQTGENGRNLAFPGLSLLIGPDGNLIDRSVPENGCEKIHMVKIDKTLLEKIRSHRMKYFLPNRRGDLFDI
jgi:N-carbamoylputrescine amidase